MKNLILCLVLFVVGACGVDDAESPTLVQLDERHINGDGGVCRDSSGQPCFCGSAVCDGGGAGGGPGGGTGGGGGGGGSPTTPFPTCRYTALCWPEECVADDMSCQICQMTKLCTDGTTLTWDDNTCYPNASCGY